jgi:hypothetical protein
MLPWYITETVWSDLRMAFVQSRPSAHSLCAAQGKVLVKIAHSESAVSNDVSMS